MKKKSEAPRQLKDNKIDNSFLLESAIPKAENERRKYVGDCAFFYGVTFRDQIKYFRGMQLTELARDDLTKDQERNIRCRLNVLYLFDKWFEGMVSEHEGNIRGIRETFPDDKNFINEVKKKYG